ncbi:hypothetical protein L2E82_31913 [Cichorium intybus]|uniref:Uncharacterized protein n=1 Tax=Cichorium intybus TaxID=13427 RepID=A0ACB9BEI2_CICIN|nr:hypothetical protein L2E82_31913 [Cichorium intybus]
MAASKNQFEFQDHLPLIEEKLGGDGLIGGYQRRIGGPWKSAWWIHCLYLVAAVRKKDNREKEEHGETEFLCEEEEEAVARAGRLENGDAGDLSCGFVHVS